MLCGTRYSEYAEPAIQMVPVVRPTGGLSGEFALLSCRVCFHSDVEEMGYTAAQSCNEFLILNLSFCKINQEAPLLEIRPG